MNHWFLRIFCTWPGVSWPRKIALWTHSSLAIFRGFCSFFLEVFGLKTSVCFVRQLMHRKPMESWKKIQAPNDATKGVTPGKMNGWNPQKWRVWRCFSFQTSELSGSSRWFFKGVMVGWLKVLKVDWVSDKWVILQMDKMDYYILHDIVDFLWIFGLIVLGMGCFYTFFSSHTWWLTNPRKWSSPRSLQSTNFKLASRWAWRELLFIKGQGRVYP